jgi:short subunit fatty acids transporter
MAKKQKRIRETDDAYFLKLVLFMILGSMWLKVSDGQSWQIPLPLGLVFGILLARHDHFRIDRKVEYAVLLIAAFIGFWAPIGIYINL